MPKDKKRQKYLMIPCRVCGAKIGQNCMANDYKQVHHERMEDAKNVERTSR
jgi:hypothetical protein